MSTFTTKRSNHHQRGKHSSPKCHAVCFQEITSWTLYLLILQTSCCRLMRESSLNKTLPPTSQGIRSWKHVFLQSIGTVKALFTLRKGIGAFDITRNGKPHATTPLRIYPYSSYSAYHCKLSLGNEQFDSLPQQRKLPMEADLTHLHGP